MNCKFCNSPTIKNYTNGVECLKCYSISTIDMPSRDEISDYYNEFNISYTGGGNAKNQSKYAYKYLNLVKKHILANSNILDIGSSTSPFPNYANLYFNVSVLDIIKPLNLNDKITFKSGFLDDNFPTDFENSFDAISAWAVLEHVSNFDLAIHNISCSLKNGGYLFLTTPEIGTFLSKYNAGKTSWFFPPEHLNIFSKKALKLMVSKYNLTLIDNGQFELNSFRFFLRYILVGFLETVFGILIYSISKKLFLYFKHTRYSYYKGIQYFILRKNS
jgi:2-polyprenyl-3-methyl-5-hydroxy-6-metoxy-1,4-benzoquinol methylase